MAYFSSNNKTSYATEFSQLLNASYCNLQLSTSDTCDLAALEYANTKPHIFGIRIEVTQNITNLTRKCPTRPCYTAAVTVTVPSSEIVRADDGDDHYRYEVMINSNRDTVVEHHPVLDQFGREKEAPCL